MSTRRRGAVLGAGGAALWLLATSVVAPLVDRVALVGLAQFVIDNSPGALATTAIEILGKAAQPVVIAGVGLGILAAGAVAGAYWSDLPLKYGWPAVLAPVTLFGTALFLLVAGVSAPVQLAAGTLLAAAPVLLYGWLVDGGAGTVTEGRRPFLGKMGAVLLGVVGIGAVARAGSTVGGGDGGADVTTTALDPINRTAQEQKRAGRTVAAGAGARQDSTAVTDKRTVGNVVVSTADGGEFGFDFTGMPKQVTPLGEHYVIDKNIDDPAIDRESWTLSVGGAAARPYELGFEDLLGHEDRVERTVTMVCISNQVGDDLISTGRWRGIPLRDLVERADPVGDVQDIVTVAADDYDEAIPWEYVREHPEVMIAYGLNGQTLDRKHGNPARLLVPGRYGMRSTKWLTEIRLDTGDHASFWERNGWDEQAVIKTLSYLRAVQRRGDRVAVGGVAYAGLRGIERVEVSYDGGDSWVEADLEEPLADLTWRRFRAVAAVDRGESELVVRATDGTGETQTQVPSEPHPDGSAGWHRKQLRL
jgi:DMSO/TMAO reductase YedYZ molybdopterin-dependent catalytic subunit